MDEKNCLLLAGGGSLGLCSIKKSLEGRSSVRDSEGSVDPEGSSDILKFVLVVVGQSLGGEDFLGEPWVGEVVMSAQVEGVA